MGFEPLIDASGNWKIGASKDYTVQMNRPWRDNLSPTFTFTGSMTCSDTTYLKIINSSVLTPNQMYFMDLVFNSSGNPWILSTSFLYSCVSQNGDCLEVQALPYIIHADNGAAIYLFVRAGTSSPHVPSGLEIMISGVSGRVGTYTCKVYAWGNL